ncbi:MAG: universal stress protein [Boseongicola sp.]
MFKNIMIPVEFQHVDRLTRVLEIAGTLAKVGGGTLHLVHVGAYPPSEDGKTLEEQEQKLENFAREVSVAQKLPVEAKSIVAHDPAAELNSQLMAAVKSTNADLVVVGSHVPVLGDYFFTSHGGYLAEHAEVSVFVVR